MKIITYLTRLNGLRNAYRITTRFWAPKRERAARTRRTLPRQRLIAFAIRFEKLVRDGVVADYAELARLGHITRARVTQIMNLLNLAPDIQEAILFLPRIESGSDPITERELLAIVAVPDWRKQRKMWTGFAGKAGVLSRAGLMGQWHVD